MKLPSGDVEVFRKAVDLLLEAESPDDARRRFEDLAGTELYCEGSRAFIEEARSRKGDAIDPASFEGEGLPLFPGRATIAVLADSIDEAEAVFTNLETEEFEVDHHLLALEGVEPAKWGTMTAPSEVVQPTPIAISRWARAYVRDHGGSVYLWSNDGRLAVAANPPTDVEFELHDVDEDVTFFTEVGFVHLPHRPLNIALERFPRKRLFVPGGSASSP